MAQNNHFFVGKTINCNGKLLDLGQIHIMGILNTTPDSFHDGGKYTQFENAAMQAEKMIVEGASIIDIGGYSTRPGATNVTEQEEIDRVLPIIEYLSKTFPHTILSVDTFRAKVAEYSILQGAGIINDISGFQFDPAIVSVAAKYRVPYVLMHVQGSLDKMHEVPNYGNLIQEVEAYFEEKIQYLKSLDLQEIILDLGFGFSKNTNHNYQLFNQIKYFTKKFNLPQLVGISHKRMVREIVGHETSQRLLGTNILNFYAMQQGASIIRVHDVKEAFASKNLYLQLDNFFIS